MSTIGVPPTCCAMNLTYPRSSLPAAPCQWSTPCDVLCPVQVMFSSSMTALEKPSSQLAPKAEALTLMAAGPEGACAERRQGAPWQDRCRKLASCGLLYRAQDLPMPAQELWTLNRTVGQSSQNPDVCRA